MTKEEISKYTPLALEALKRYTIGHQIGWFTIASEIGLPEQYWNDLKDVFVYEGYINVEMILKEGDIVRSTSRVTAALLGLLKEEKPTENHYHEHYTTLGDQSPIAKGNLNMNISGEGKEGLKINKKILFWTIAIVLLTALLVLLALKGKA